MFSKKKKKKKFKAKSFNINANFRFKTSLNLIIKYIIISTQQSNLFKTKRVKRKKAVKTSCKETKETYFSRKTH